MDFSSHNPRTSNALSLAARNNDVHNLRRFLKKINPNSVDNRGWTCLHEAAYHDSLECLQIILKRRSCRPLVESHEGHTALYVACLNTFSTRCIQYLLEEVEDIANYGSKEGFTPLHLVSRQGRTDALQLLLDHGAIINVEDFDGDTPLHEACMAMQPEIVNLLLHAGAYPEIPNERNFTPLHIASGSRGCLESVKYLYPFITNINVKDSNGETPLMTACQGENEDVIQFILEHGGDPNVVNNSGKRAVDLALERGLVRGFKLLFEATERDKISLDLVYMALSPNNLKIDIIDIILASDLPPDFFTFTKATFRAILSTHFHQSFYGEMTLYKTFAPMITFLNVAEYIYKLSVDKFNELFYYFLMKGLSVNATERDEMPPLIGLLYCPHSECFDYVLDLMVKFGCNLDYRSKFFKCGDYFERMNELPDVFHVSMCVDPVTLPSMIKYSLHCDPEFVLEIAREIDVLDQLPTSTTIQLINMIDSDCGITDVNNFRYYVPTLKHLCRLGIRNVIKNTGSFKNSEQYLNMLDKLPLPAQMKRYLRFM